MKRLWILGLGMAMLLTMGIAQVAHAEVPENVGGYGSKNCIGYCESRGKWPRGTDAEMVHKHINDLPVGCMGATNIRDAAPPSPQE